jgi:hypothetical protein
MIKAQSRGAIEKLQKDNDSLDSAQSSIESFAGNREIKSEAFDNLKQQISDMSWIIQSIRASNDAEIADHEAFITAVGDEELDGNHILMELESARNIKIADEQEQDGYYQLMATTPIPLLRDYYATMAAIYGEIVRYDQQMIESWEAKEAKYDAIEAATSGLFTSVAEVRTAITTGLTEIGGAFQNGVYQPNMNAKWRTDLLDVQTKRLMTVDADGKVTVNWEETEKVLKKDAGDITEIEYMILSQMYLGMEDEDLEQFFLLLMENRTETPTHCEWSVNQEKMDHISSYLDGYAAVSLLMLKEKGTEEEVLINRIVHNHILHRAATLGAVQEIGTFHGGLTQSKPIFYIDIKEYVYEDVNKGDPYAENMITLNFYEVGPKDETDKSDLYNIRSNNSKVTVYPTFYQGMVDDFAIEHAKSAIISMFDVPSKGETVGEFLSNEAVGSVKDQITNGTVNMVRNFAQQTLSKEAAKGVAKSIIGITTPIIGNVVVAAYDYEQKKREQEKNANITISEFTKVKDADLLGDSLDCSAVYVDYDTFNKQEITMDIGEGILTEKTINNLNDAFETNFTFEEIVKNPLPLIKIKKENSTLFQEVINNLK